MKKSQIFLGASAFILATAGVFATKNSLRTIKHVVGWTSFAGSFCYRLPLERLYTTIQHDGAIAAHTQDAGIKTLYTATGPVGRTLCGKIVYTNAQN